MGWGIDSDLIGVVAAHPWHKNKDVLPRGLPDGAPGHPAGGWGTPASGWRLFAACYADREMRRGSGTGLSNRVPGSVSISASTRKMN